MTCKSCNFPTTGSAYCESCLSLMAMEIDPRREREDDYCPKCNSELTHRQCDQCEDGVIDLDDPEWTDTAKCDTCNGTGHEVWCRQCGWDVTYNHFLNPQYEADWLASEEETTDETQTNKTRKRLHHLG